MNIPETYDYLIRARRDLWATLEALSDEVLSRPLLDGSRFHCIRDLLFHIPDVEDGWINGGHPARSTAGLLAACRAEYPYLPR